MSLDDDESSDESDSLEQDSYRGGGGRLGIIGGTGTTSTDGGPIGIGIGTAGPGAGSGAIGGNGLGTSIPTLHRHCWWQGEQYEKKAGVQDGVHKHGGQGGHGRPGRAPQEADGLAGTATCIGICIGTG